MGFLFGNRIYKTTNMTSYSNTAGGGMLGGHRGCEVRKFADRTILSFYEAKTHAHPNCHMEYEVEEKIFEDLTKVFRKHRMYHWNDKKFTNIFVCDGESESYAFSFGTEGRIRFSSQLYPKKYATKLAELDQVIARYRDTATKLPALKQEAFDEEYFQNLNLPTDGNITLSVTEYSLGCITYIIGNGTEEPVTLETSYELINPADGSVIVASKDSDSSEIMPQRGEEFYIRKIPFLEAGTYLLKCGDLQATFELE